MSKEQWIADVERLQERLADEKIDVDTFTAEMRWMGFYDPEIASMISEIRELQS